MCAWYCVLEQYMTIDINKLSQCLKLPRKNYLSLTLVYHVWKKSGEKVWNKPNRQQWISDGVLKCLKPPIANQEMQLAGGGIFAHDLHVSIVFVVWAKIIWWKETAILFSLYCTSIGHPFGHWVIYHCGYCYSEWFICSCMLSNTIASTYTHIQG